MAETKTTALAEQTKNISEQVLAKIKQFESVGLQLPKSYSLDNAMKAAWLVLQETVDRGGKPALQVCTRESIANALLDMVLQGLSVAKKQGYFIVYGNKLEFQRSYFGTVAVALKTGKIAEEPVANVIYEGDDFVFEIDPTTGHKRIVKHEQKIANMDNARIVGAYAVIKRTDGQTDLEIMTMDQIRSAWNQGATKGKSPAHANFVDQMAKKTVIGRACKMIVNSSDDAWLFEGKKDEFDAQPTDERDAQVQRQGAQTFVEDADYEEVASERVSPRSEASAPEKQNDAPNAQETASDEPY